MKLHFEKISIHQHETFRIQRNILPYFDAPWHYHPECELVLIEEGWGKRFVCDNIENFLPGDLVLLGANTPHVWKSDNIFYTGDYQLQSSAIIIQFAENAFGHDFLNLPEMRPIRHLIQLAQRGIRFKSATQQQVKEKISKLLQLEATQRLIGLIEILHLLASSADQVILGTPGFMSSMRHHDVHKINKVYEYTTHHFMQQISLETVAELADMNKASFCRYFKAKTKKTFTQYLNEIRIGYACHLLIEGNLSVSQIAYTCGFQHPAYFNKIFKAIKAQTPLTYQQQYKLAELE